MDELLEKKSVPERQSGEVEKLEPCPLCPDGGKPYFTKTVNGTNMAYVGCSQCGLTLKAQVQFLTSREDWTLSKDIIAIWNTRALPEQQWQDIIKEFRRQIVEHCRGLELQFNWKREGEIAGAIGDFVEKLSLPAAPGQQSQPQPTLEREDSNGVVSQMVGELEAICEAEDHDLYCASIFKPEEKKPCDCHISRIRKLITAYWCGQQSAQPQSELLPCQECGAPAFWLPSEGEGWFAIDHLANCQRAASMAPLRQLIYLSRLSAQPTIESAEEAFHRGVDMAKDAIRVANCGAGDDHDYCAAVFITAIARKCGFTSNQMGDKK